MDSPTVHGEVPLHFPLPYPTLCHHCSHLVMDQPRGMEAQAEGLKFTLCRNLGGKAAAVGGPLNQITFSIEEPGDD